MATNAYDAYPGGVPPVLRDQGEAALDALPKALESNARMRTALEQISRMKGHPDKSVCLMTLAAAAEIARQALGLPSKLGTSRE